MQVLEPPKTESFSNKEGHFIKTFLISSKRNAADWQVSKDTLKEKVQTFVGKPFVIVPDELSSPRQKGHIFKDTREELLQEYKKHTHGIISSISEPFEYNDGTGDIFYMANVKLSNSKAATALMEHGAKTWVPFAVSPHIWVNGEDSEIIQDWEGISLSLVPQGAYGRDAVVSKYCKGEEQACTNSLAAGLCEKEDSKAASMISSLVSNTDLNTHMATVVEHPQVKEVQDNNTQPISEDKKDTVSLTKEEHEQYLKEKEEKEQLKQQLQALVTENKTTKLNNIFKSVKDESLKKTLTEKYFNADVNVLNDFYGDVSAHVFPALVEEAKAQAENDLKNKLTEENKAKSKGAASLPKEPDVKDDSKAGSIVPKSVNEILKLRQMLEVGF